jgi:membrane protease YdiL (CAAX protease family)
MSEHLSLVLPAGFPATEPRGERLLLGRRKWITLLETAIGFLLIMVTVWTPRPLQTRLFWMAAAWVVACSVAAAWRNERRGFKLPSLKASALMIASGLLVAAGLIAIAAAAGTLHGLFGAKDPLRHAGAYICWAIIQQYIQQMFFFTRFEQVTRNGMLAGFIAALLFGVVHLPNPVLAPVTLFGGWLLSELFRRYRTVLPLGIGHGLVGLAIALSVPDHIQHHMRVGLGYLRYMG